MQQDLEPILETSLANLDNIKGGYKGSPKFPTFNLYETLLYFYNKSHDRKFLDPVKLIINKLCSRGIYDHVEGGIARYTVDEDWIIPHFEKCFMIMHNLFYFFRSIVKLIQKITTKIN